MVYFVLFWNKRRELSFLLPVMGMMNKLIHSSFVEPEKFLQMKKQNFFDKQTGGGGGGGGKGALTPP